MTYFRSFDFAVTEDEIHFNKRRILIGRHHEAADHPMHQLEGLKQNTRFKHPIITSVTKSTFKQTARDYHVDQH